MYGSTVYGTIESVQEVLLETLETGSGSIFEHAVGPGEQLVVRLDDGRAVTVVQNEAPRFEPGERVIVLSGARVEHAR
jgi:outer membrane lipoprotein SlyB